MPTENEPITAEKMLHREIRRITRDLPRLRTACHRQDKSSFALLDGIRHALCVFDPAFAKRVRELEFEDRTVKPDQAKSLR